MGGKRVSTRLYFMLVSICVIVAATSNTPELIVDGILIGLSGGTSQNAIKSLDSVWTLHVVVGSISNELPINHFIPGFNNELQLFLPQVGQMT